MQSGHVSVAQVRGAPRVQSPLPIPAPLSSQLPQQQHPQMPPSSSPPPSPPSPSPPAPRSHPHLNIHSHHPQNPPHAYPRAHSHSHSYTNTQTHTRTSPRPRLDTTQQPPASTVSMTTPTANTTPTNSSSNPAPNSVPAPAPTSTSASTSSSSTAVLCDVCCEHVAPSSLRGCSACLHRYCLSCVEKYWTAAVYSGNHAHLLCMYGGCGIFASDSDVASVVSHRTFRKMLYFRSRDAFNHCPNARWCAVDLCWHYLGNFPLSVPNPSSSLHSSATPNNASISNSSSSLPRQFKTPSRSGDRHVVADESPALTSERRSKGGVHRPRYSIPSSASSSPIVACPRCSGKTCVACEREVTTSAPVHVCASRRSNKAHNALFTMWAMLHTKSCPACAARIQRNHGCSHMTCTRCSSYFCWRCKGFLNNGCPLPGRACICDRVMTAAAYSGLAVLGVVGSPVIVAALVVAGPPYLAYRLLHARRSRSRSDDVSPYAHVLHQMDVLAANGQTARGRHGRSAPRNILHPTELLTHDDDFDTESTRYAEPSSSSETSSTSSSSSSSSSSSIPSDSIVAHVEGENINTGVREDIEDVSSDGTNLGGTGRSLNSIVGVGFEAERTSRSESPPPLHSSRAGSSLALIRARRGVPWSLGGSSRGHIELAAQRATRYVFDGVLTHSDIRGVRRHAVRVNEETCVVSRPFVLERRRGSIES